MAPRMANNPTPRRMKKMMEHLMKIVKNPCRRSLVLTKKMSPHRWKERHR